MKKQNILLMIFFICILNSHALFSLQFRHEFFKIQNSLDKEIIVYIEIYSEYAIIDYEHLKNENNGIYIGIRNFGPVIRIPPGKSKYCISYYPIGDIENKYIKLAKIPILDKLRMIFRSLIITDTGNNILLTLDDIQSETITNLHNDHDTYILNMVTPR